MDTLKFSHKKFVKSISIKLFLATAFFHQDLSGYQYHLYGLKRDRIDEFCHKIDSGENLVFTKFGDGEILCMMGVQGANCDGDMYHSWLGQNLKQSLVGLLKKPNTYLGLWNHPYNETPLVEYYFHTLINTHFCVKDHYLEKPYLANFVYYNTLINDDTFNHDQSLYNFIKTIRKTKRKKILMCNLLNARLKDFFLVDAVIILPYRNWSQEYGKYKNELLSMLEKDAIILIMGGLCSKVLINEITDEFKVSFFDIGSGFDYLSLGIKTRDHKHDLISELFYYKDFLPSDWIFNFPKIK